MKLKYRFSRLQIIGNIKLTQWWSGISISWRKRDNKSKNCDKKRTWWSHNDALLTCCRSLFLFVHFSNCFHDAVVRTRLYSQKITHHLVNIEDGEWFYLVAYFKDRTPSEEDRICFSILRGPAVTPIDPFSWSGGGVRLNHSPPNVWLNKDRRNSSVVFPVLVFWYLLFRVNMKWSWGFLVRLL